MRKITLLLLFTICILVILNILLNNRYFKLYEQYNDLYIKYELVLEDCAEKNDIPILIMNLKVTAYNSDPNQTDSTPFFAAWGNEVYDGMIAVSRDLEQLGLKRGTKLLIDGEEYTIDDRMHKRKKKQLDIWMENIEDAEIWGVQEKEIVIIDPNVIENIIKNVREASICQMEKI